MTTPAAYLFLILSSVVVCFQWLIFFKFPWGEYTMGGQMKGILPKPYRIAALVQSFLLAFNAWVVLEQANILTLLSEGFVFVWMWVVVFIMGISMLMNLASRSKKERNLWAPVTILMFILVILVWIK